MPARPVRTDVALAGAHHERPRVPSQGRPMWRGIRFESGVALALQDGSGRAPPAPHGPSPPGGGPLPYPGQMTTTAVNGNLISLRLYIGSTTWVWTGSGWRPL